MAILISSLKRFNVIANNSTLPHLEKCLHPPLKLNHRFEFSTRDLLGNLGNDGTISHLQVKQKVVDNSTMCKHHIVSEFFTLLGLLMVRFSAMMVAKQYKILVRDLKILRS